MASRSALRLDEGADKATELVLPPASKTRCAGRPAACASWATVTKPSSRVGAFEERERRAQDGARPAVKSGGLLQGVDARFGFAAKHRGGCLLNRQQPRPHAQSNHIHSCPRLYGERWPTLHGVGSSRLTTHPCDLGQPGAAHAISPVAAQTQCINCSARLLSAERRDAHYLAQPFDGLSAHRGGSFP